MRPSVRNTMALAAAGAIVVCVLVVASGVGNPRFAATWVALASTAVAVLLIAVRAFAPASLLSIGALALVSTGLASATEGSSLARGLAILAPPCAVALAGLSITPRRGMGALVTVGGAVIAGPVRSLFFDPFLDPECADCRHSAFAVLGDNGIAGVLGVAGGVILVVGLALLVPVSGLRAAAVAAAVSALLAILPAVVGQSPMATVSMGIAALAGVFVSVRMLRSRARLEAFERAPQSPDALLAALRRVFRDPSLEVHYLAASAGWVNATGQAIPTGPVSAPASPATPVAHGIRVAHQPTTKVASTVADGLPPRLLLSLEEQRLTAELAAELRELDESRSRVVRRADEERRRLERDLHDGAQQHLLALGFDLRRALTDASEPATRAGLERCLGLTMDALDDMRDIAHGIYPPLLAVAGLRPALGSLPGVVISDTELSERLPPSVERLAYLVVEDLARGSKHDVILQARVEDATLILDIVGGETEPGALIRERIHALGGTLSRRATSWRLETPCE